MAFLLRCPRCGERDVYEFTFGGEFRKRPSGDASDEDWYSYMYENTNQAGLETEWWYHRLGCRRWFIAIRDTRDNSTLRTFWPGEDQKGDRY